MPVTTRSSSRGASSRSQSPVPKEAEATMTSTTRTIQSLVIAAFNGPPVIGIGGTTDKGLAAPLHHALPFDPSEYTYAPPFEFSTFKTKTGNTVIPNAVFSTDLTAAYVDYNLKQVFKFDQTATDNNVTDTKFLSEVERDLKGILVVLLAYNLHYKECRDCTKEIMAHPKTYTDDEWEGIANADSLNRALTYVAARVHTKYQTNHAMGGNPAVGAIASCMRAYYNLNIVPTSPVADKRKYEFLYKSIYWATHPVNEAYILVQIIRNSCIMMVPYHSKGSSPVSFDLAEYMSVRSDTTAATTHYFSVGVACMHRLRDFGLLTFLPTPSRILDLVLGYRQAMAYGARCHPAASHWGLVRCTLVQRRVESLLADLGYAIRQLFPNDTLAMAPACVNATGLSGSWKVFIDGIKLKMEEAVAENIKPETMRRVLPTLTDGAEDYVPTIFSKLLEADSDDVLEDMGWSDSAQRVINGLGRLSEKKAVTLEEMVTEEVPVPKKPKKDRRKGHKAAEASSDHDTEE